MSQTTTTVDGRSQYFQGLRWNVRANGTYYAVMNRCPFCNATWPNEKECSEHWPECEEL